MDAFVSQGSGRTPPSPGRRGMTLDERQLLSRHEDGAELSMALWRFRSPLLALSSAPYGGGWGERHWILAAQVAGGYHRTDPAGHLAGLAGDLGLEGPGIGMLTAVDVRRVTAAREDGVAAAATVGLTHPSWAAAADAGTTAATAAPGISHRRAAAHRRKRSMRQEGNFVRPGPEIGRPAP